MLIAHFRAYEVEQKSRTTLRRKRNRGRPGRRRGKPSDMPSQLRALQPFPDWLTVAVDTHLAAGSRSIDQTTYDLSRPPSLHATAYRSMKAYGMHFRCRSVEASSTTMDSGVHATFTDDAGVATDEYMGHVEEILELDYRRTCVVVFVCSWVKGRIGGVAATMKRDEHGYLSMNFADHYKVPLGPQSFAFPIHVQQVFFVADEGPWKVVCKVEVRGSRGGRAFAEEHDDADTQISGPVSSRANNIDRRRTEPSQVEDFVRHGSFVDGHVEEAVAADADDEESDHLLGDSSDSEQ